MKTRFANRAKIHAKRSPLAESHLADCLTQWIADLSADEQSAIRAFAEENEDLFLRVFAGSSFLTRIIRTRPRLLSDLAKEGPDVFSGRIILETSDIDADCGREDLMKRLRLNRQGIALATALADVAGVWTLDEVTENLTRFADACVGSVLDWLLADKAREFGLASPPDAAQSGGVILGMGKYGARELNYSSDIDIVVFYDLDGFAGLKGGRLSDFWIELTKDLAAILQSVTEDGHVFRVDLRLRPDPGTTAVAVSVPAAEAYYESFGQNWERAAFIKARQVAGDIEAGRRLFAVLSPFVWRKNLDFAAIEDVHAMKRQIHAVRGHGQIAVEGHNIKLGRGGIREIEFFVQTQQLIAGGRDPELRGARTCETLSKLAEREWIEKEAVSDLTTAYHFLRGMEHRLQMQQDEQTHTLPKAGDRLETFSEFCGYETVGDFRKALTGVLETVQTHYVALFEKGEVLANETGNLVFAGSENDPETLETLSHMGFHRPAQISEKIRGWHSGRFAAIRTPRARELLTRLMPRILKSLSQTPDPNFAFARFHDFLKGLPSGIQIFSLFQSNPELLNLITDIAGTAPRLSAQLSRRPEILDGLLDPDFNRSLPDLQGVVGDLETHIGGAGHYEEMLDAVRRWQREKIFRIGTQILSGKLSGPAAGEDFTKIAEASACILFRQVMSDMLGGGKLPEGAGMAVVAMGKLGSREMTAASDLDLILVCEADDYSREIEYGTPSSLEVFFSRATRRFISAMTVPTSEGGLYEVDMRLRPSGNSGPLVAKINSFEDYQLSSAWFWEHMALTRGRVLIGEAGLSARLDKLRQSVFALPREVGKTKRDVLEMRRKIAAHHAQKPLRVWDLKHAPGGLVDIEFLAQGLCLLHAQALSGRIDVSTGANLQALGKAGILPDEDVRLLAGGLSLYAGLQQIFRLCLESRRAPPYSAALNLLLCQSAGLPDMRHLEDTLAGTQNAIRTIFVREFGTLPG